jgi:hypothetical protein
MTGLRLSGAWEWILQVLAQPDTEALRTAAREGDYVSLDVRGARLRCRMKWKECHVEVCCWARET